MRRRPGGRAIGGGHLAEGIVKETVNGGLGRPSDQEISERSRRGIRREKDLQSVAPPAAHKGQEKQSIMNHVLLSLAAAALSVAVPAAEPRPGSRNTKENN